jgi:hypothetical protein
MNAARKGAAVAAALGLLALTPGVASAKHVRGKESAPGQNPACQVLKQTLGGKAFGQCVRGHAQFH